MIGIFWVVKPTHDLSSITFELNSLIGTNVQVQSLWMFIKQSLHKMDVHSPKVIYFLISGLALTTNQ